MALLAGFRSSESLPDHIAHYRVVRLCGGGSAGTVYEAIDDRNNQSVAVKVLSAGGVAHRRDRERFEHEIKRQSALSHPNIAKVIEAGEFTPPGGRPLPFMAMEYIDGQDLDEYCRRSNLRITQVVELFVKVCRAVGYTHANQLAHRDLKPANILVTKTGEPKIVDFGLVRDLSGGASTLHTLHQVAIGTAAYMPPEQARGDHNKVDARSDVYSLGAVLYQLVTGRLPIAVDDAPLQVQLARIIDDRYATAVGAPSCVDETDIRLDAIIGKCLSRDPDRRYSNANELADDLEAYVARRTLSVGIPSRAERALAFIRRYRKLVIASFAVATLLSVTTIASLLWLRESKRAESIARRAEAEAIQNADHVSRMERDALRRLADSYIDKAWVRYNEGDASEALLWLTSAMDIDQDDRIRTAVHRVRYTGIRGQTPTLLSIEERSQEATPAISDKNIQVELKVVDLEETGKRATDIIIRSAGGSKLITGPIRREMAAFNASISKDGTRIAVPFERGSFKGRVDVIDATKGIFENATNYEAWDVSTGRRVLPNIPFARCIAISAGTGRVFFQDEKQVGYFADLLPGDRPLTELTKEAQALSGNMLDKSGIASDIGVAERASILAVSLEQK